MPLKALITGAGGFSGYHLQRELQDTWQVIALDRVPSAANAPNYLVCDVTDSERLTHIIRSSLPDAIFHLAGVTAAYTQTPETFYHVNFLGTLNLLEAVRQNSPAAKVLIVTSSAMYGRLPPGETVFTEESPLRPVNAYGVSKAMQHHLGYQYAVQYGLQVIRVCPFNLIGPRLPRGLVASDFAYQIAAIEAGWQEPVIEVGDLRAGRDMLDVRDAVRAYHLLLEHGQAGETYNVAAGEAIVIGDLLSILLEKSNVKVTIKVREGARNPSLIPAQIGDSSKLKAATGWQPRISIEQSLHDTLNFWRESVQQQLSNL